MLRISSSWMSLLLVATLLGKAHAAEDMKPTDPVGIIRQKDSELQKLLRSKEVGKKSDRVKALINGIFDFEELGKRALGPDTWKSMKADQQKRFVKAFKNMVENASVKKLEAYQSDSTTYETPEIIDGKTNVVSHVFSKGTESIVTYKLMRKDATWKAWDLIIDDLSTARNYGDQFKTILKTSNMDGLISKLEKKASSEKPAPAPAKTPAKTPAKVSAKSLG